MWNEAEVPTSLEDKGEVGQEEEQLQDEAEIVERRSAVALVLCSGREALRSLCMRGMALLAGV